MMIIYRPRHTRQCRGFTLTEMAIVLLAVSAIVGAIWLAAEHVWDNYRIYRANQQIMSSVQNIREQYGNSVAAWTGAGIDETGAFDKQGLFPTEMRRDPYGALGSSAIDHALNASYAGGSFHIITESNPISGATVFDVFRVQLLGVSEAACIKLLMSAPVAEGSIGLIKIGTQMMANNQILYNGASTAAGGVAYVMVPATAQAWCNGTNDINEVDYDFRLHN